MSRYTDAVDELPTAIFSENRPSWNGFDTFLRRAAMIGGVILIWVAIALSILGASAVVSVVHNVNQLNQSSTTDMWSTDQEQGN
jgi:hypothetical protein